MPDSAPKKKKKPAPKKPTKPSFWNMINRTPPGKAKTDAYLESIGE